MNEPDPLLARLRDLPDPPLDGRTRDAVLRAAQAELAGHGPSAFARGWSTWGLPAVLLVSEAVYLVDVIGKVRAIFFG